MNYKPSFYSHLIIYSAKCFVNHALLNRIRSIKNKKNKMPFEVMERRCSRCGTYCPCKEHNGKNYCLPCYINELQAENERLKVELEKDVTCKILSEYCNSLKSEIKILEKRNAELRCLVLHAMCRWLDSWSICVGINIMKHRKFKLF